jgi:hypothetical protein
VRLPLKNQSTDSAANSSVFVTKSQGAATASQCSVMNDQPHRDRVSDATKFSKYSVVEQKSETRRVSMLNRCSKSVTTSGY